jgi:hypothetical protein
VIVVVILRDRNLRRPCVIAKEREDDERDRDQNEDERKPLEKPNIRQLTGPSPIHRSSYFSAPPVIPRTNVSMKRL